MGLGFSEKIRDVSSPDKVFGDEDYIKDGDIDGVEMILMTRMLLRSLPLKMWRGTAVRSEANNGPCISYKGEVGLKNRRIF